MKKFWATLVGILAGIVGGVALIALLEYLDDRKRRKAGREEPHASMNYYFVAHSAPIFVAGKAAVELGNAWVRLSAILSSYPKWLHYIDGFWVIGTQDTIKQVRMKLEVGLPKRGFFLLIWPCDLQVQYEGLMPAEAWRWLNDEAKGMAENVATFSEGGTSP